MDKVDPHQEKKGKKNSKNNTANQHQQSHTGRRVITLRRVRTSLNLVPHVHLRLISSTYVLSDHTPNIWRWDVDRGAPGRGEALRFILMNSGCRRSTMRSSLRTCDSCSERCHSRQKNMIILSARLKSKKSVARRPSTSSSIEPSKTRRPSFKRSWGNQLRQIWSTVQRDHRSGLHWWLSDHPS
jgi:hypothetical protein